MLRTATRRMCGQWAPSLNLPAYFELKEVGNNYRYKTDPEWVIDVVHGDCVREEGLTYIPEASTYSVSFFQLINYCARRGFKVQAYGVYSGEGARAGKRWAVLHSEELQEVHRATAPAPHEAASEAAQPPTKYIKWGDNTVPAERRMKREDFAFYEQTKHGGKVSTSESIDANIDGETTAELRDIYTHGPVGKSEWGTATVGNYMMNAVLVVSAIVGAVHLDVLGRSGNIDTVWDVSVVGDTAYLATGRTGLVVINVSLPASPKILGWYQTPHAKSIDVKGTTAYLADTRDGMFVFNVATATPELLATFPGGNDRVRVHDDMAYLVSGPSIDVLNITDPTLPFLIRRYNTGSDATTSFFVSGHTVYATVASEVHVIDFMNPKMPTLVERIPSDVVRASAVFVHNNVIYIGTSGIPGMHAKRLYKPHTTLGTDWETGNVVCIEIKHGVGYLVGNSRTKGRLGLVGTEVGVSNVGHYLMNNAVAVHVTVSRKAYLSHREGLDILDVSTPTAPTRIGRYQQGHDARKVHVSGGRAFVIDFDKGLQVFDVHDPENPILLGTASVRNGRAVHASGTTVYVGGEQLYVIDASSPSSIRFISTHNILVEDLHVVGDRMYVASGNEGVYIFDVSKRSAVVLAAVYSELTMYVTSVFYDTSTMKVFATDNFKGLMVLDISILSAIQLVQTVMVARPVAVRVARGAVYIAASTTVVIININVPEDGNILAVYNVTVPVHDVRVVGETAYVAAGNKSLILLNLTDRHAPKEIVGSSTSGSANGVHISGNTAFVADVGLWVVGMSHMDRDVNMWPNSYFIRGVFPESTCDAFLSNSGLVRHFNNIILLAVVDTVIIPSVGCYRSRVVLTAPIRKDPVAPENITDTIRHAIQQEPELLEALGEMFRGWIDQVSTVECEVPGVPISSTWMGDKCVAMECRYDHTLEYSAEGLRTVCRTGHGNSRDFRVLYGVVPGAVCALIVVIACLYVYRKRVREDGSPASQVISAADHESCDDGLELPETELSNSCV